MTKFLGVSWIEERERERGIDREQQRETAY